MDRDKIYEWLKAVRDQQMTPDEALAELAGFPYQDLGFANVDTHRHLRKGNAEVIYCPGKKVEHIVDIFKVLAEKSTNVLATRANRVIFKALQAQIPEIQYFEAAKIVGLWRERKFTNGQIGVISAGTADIRVAEEAAITAEFMGSTVTRIYDVGVAGIHRLFDKMGLIEKCRVVIVVAGMEGALASVVGGLISKPIIAVPTSVGYGTNFQGVAPLLSMLNSCASGVGVVNIDNGFGAGVLGHQINLLGE